MTGTDEMTGSGDTEKVTCSRCGRALRSAASVAAGIGPRCAAVEAAEAGLNARQAEKMAQLIIDKAIVPAGRKGLYHVAGEDGEVVHRVHVNGNCTCEWGLRRKNAATKVCYHAGAARLLATPLVRKRPAPVLPVVLPAPDAIWAALDAVGATAGALAPF